MYYVCVVYIYMKRLILRIDQQLISCPNKRTHTNILYYAARDYYIICRSLYQTLRYKLAWPLHL